MSDLLLQLGTNPTARQLVRNLGLPLPLPEPLRRDKGPWRERPLADAAVVVGATENAELVGLLSTLLTTLGANPYLSLSAPQAQLFEAPGEALGRPARGLDSLTEKQRPRAVLFDATGVGTVGELRALYELLHPVVSRLDRSGRVLVLGRPLAGLAPGRAAAQAALDGFVRSVAKELGRSGVTANLVRVEPGAEARAGAVLRWLLSPHSAYVTAQSLTVDSRAAGHADAPTRPLEKRVALVTGAARGIGEATARALAREGAHVVCHDRPADSALVSQLARELGGSVALAELGTPDAEKLLCEAVERAGGLDVLVHNAGITRDKTLARMKPEQWDSVLEINLAAVLRATEALLPSMRTGGRIVCLSSVTGLAGNLGQSNYAATKSALLGWVAALAPSLAERGCTVNAVAPGFIETRMTAAIPVAIREAARRLSALNQGGLPRDVAEAVLFLASPGAVGLTGRTLRVCGGALVGA